MDEELDLREALLAEAEECLDHGDPEGALQSAEEVLSLDGQAVEAHHLRALALRELDRPAEALAAAESALRLDEAFAEAAYTRADLLIFDLGEPELALDICDHFLRQELEDTLYSDFLNLKGNALCELGDFIAALACFERASELDPEREDIGSRGWAMFELGRMDEAVQALEQACQPGPSQNPANHFYLAVALARLGDERGSARHFRIAARLDPDIYHVPRPLTDAEALDALELALAGLPATLLASLEGVPRQARPWPELSDFGRGADHVSPLALVRLTGGQPLAVEEEAGQDPEPTSAPRQPPRPPEAIELYLRNLAFSCVDRETMVEELQVACWREIVHYLGLGDEEVESHGVH